ncbi:hypothetical protein D3C72_838680 [compost metagenome]
MAGAGKMRVREADDAAVVITIARCPAIGLLSRLDARIRTELDHAERHRRTGVGVTLAAGADERIDRGIGLVGGGHGGGGHSQARGEHRRGGDSDQETTVQRGHRHLDRFRWWSDPSTGVAVSHAAVRMPPSTCASATNWMDRRRD